MRNINLRYVDEAYDENGLLTKFDITMPDNFNFAYDVVDDIAINDPERTAMVWCNPEGEEHTFTFADMKTWSDKTANFMADCGIGRGDFVMVILRRHYQFWFTMLALEKLGAVAVPATFMLKEHDLTYRLNGADIKAIIATSAGDIAGTIDAVVKECPSVETLILVNPAGAGLTPRDEDGNWVAPAGELVGEALSGPAGICAAPVAREGWRDFNSEVRAASADFTRRETAGADPMLMYFSSGTSGNPKMVLHDSGYALAHLVTAKHWHNVNPEGLHFTIADTGWGKAVWGKFVGRYGVTTLCCPPTMYRLMTEVDVDAFDLSSLEYCTTAGEALNPDLFDFWREHTGLTIYEGFGQTETPLTVGNLTNSTPRPGSMGKPVPMYVMRILRDDGTECDTGETGEICISIDPHPAGIMMEYYRNAEKTAEAMHDGWYHTGDTAWRDEEGNYWYVGRNDDVIKSSGYRIGPFEIESVMLEHDAVREVAVTGVPDPVRGFAVKATVVLADGWQGSDDLTAELQKWVKRQTAPYKYPRIIEYVDELPRTVNGKIRRPPSASRTRPTTPRRRPPRGSSDDGRSSCEAPVPVGAGHGGDGALRSGEDQLRPQPRLGRRRGRVPRDTRRYGRREPVLPLERVSRSSGRGRGAAHRAGVRPRGHEPRRPVGHRGTGRGCGGGLSRRDGAYGRHRGCRRRRCGRHGARALRAGPRSGALCHALRGERLPQPHAGTCRCGGGAARDRGQEPFGGHGRGGQLPLAGRDCFGTHRRKCPVYPGSGLDGGPSHCLHYRPHSGHSAGKHGAMRPGRHSQWLCCERVRQASLVLRAAHSR